MAINPPQVTVGGPRGEEMMELLGTRTFALKSPQPIRASLPGIPDALVYLLDVDALPPADIEKLARYFARKFNGRLSDVRKEIRRDGIPVLADNCTIVVDLRMLL